MNYYRRYVGDYLKKTARISLVDHGAYSVMLDHYYAEERPLPLDVREIYTMCRAIRPEEQQSVDKVLERYFVKGKDGFRNKRADEEIAAAQKARENGSKGGRPKTGNGTDHETGNETEDQTGDVTEPQGGKGGGSGHPPTTNLHPPAVTPPTAKEKASSGGAPDKARQRREAREAGTRAIAYLNEKAGTRYRPTEANLKFPTGRILQDGATEAELLAVVDAKCKDWLGNPEMRKYLRPETLWNATKFSQYLGQLNVSAAAGGKSFLVLVRLTTGDSQSGRVLLSFNATGKVDAWDVVMRVAKNGAHRRSMLDHKGYIVIEKQGFENGDQAEVLGRYSPRELEEALR